MHVEVQRADLSKALTQITRVVEAGSIISVLGNVLVSTADGVMTLRGTDLRVEITCTIPCVGDAITACITAKDFADIAKRLAGDVVSLDFDAGDAGTGILIAKSGRSRFRLPSVSATSFPTLAVREYDCAFKADLGKLFAFVTPCITVPNAKHPRLEGVFLHLAGGRLRAVGTDSARLAVYDIPAPEGSAAFEGALLPLKLANLLSTYKGEQDLRFRKDRVLLNVAGATGSTTICALLLEDEYVAYMRAVPSNDRVVRIHKADLAAAAARVGLVASDVSGKAVRLNIAPGSIELVAIDHDGREATDEIAVDYHGEPTYVAFNCGFLETMLACVPGEEIAFEVTDNTTHTRVRSLSDDAFIGVLSPYRM